MSVRIFKFHYNPISNLKDVHKGPKKQTFLQLFFFFLIWTLGTLNLGANDIRRVEGEIYM
jgi:hypothetical protein